MTEKINPEDYPDPFNLHRFVTAQESNYAAALAELQDGRKRTHWMWYVFPQLEGLGHSPMARLYAIKSRDEAQRYLNHPVLGPRLRKCAQALLSHSGLSLAEILGHPDDMKLKSSMTLFASVAEPQSPFEQVLDQYCGGERDSRTLELLADHE